MINTDLNNSTIYVIGKLDCQKVTLCRLIVEDLDKKQTCLVKFEFQLYFENQFECYYNELLKDNINFMEYKQSPIIYIKVRMIYNIRIIRQIL